MSAHDPFKELPTPRARRSTTQGELSTLSLHLKTITPIMGGGVEARRVSQHQPIRPASVRGQLRFWWRALNLHRFPTAKALKDAEADLWGGPTAEKRDAMKASAISIDVTKISSDIVEKGDPPKDAFYATWPARGTRDTNATERWSKGLTFHLTLMVPSQREEELRDVLKAWLLFGGYGGRTRRGMGALTVATAVEASQWLPKDSKLETLKGFFKTCPQWLTDQSLNKRETPTLKGAVIALASPSKNAHETWLRTIHWLNDFRQGQPTGRSQSPKYARVGVGDKMRPSISNWPEPDKIRQLNDRFGPFTHKPRHNNRPVWPRAGFGLPIQVRFVKQDRQRRRDAYKEPHPATININGEQSGRLASPLIIKPMAIGDGTTFVACALWLNRAFPSDDMGPALATPRNSKAKWDELVAPGDECYFEPLAVGQKAPKGKRLQTAFFHWLKAREGNVTISS